MKIDYGLEISQSQKIIVSTNLVQSLKILSMTTLELEDEIKKQIIQLNKEQNLPKNSTQLYAFNEIKDNQKFYIVDDTIVIFFDLYDIAPYVAGIPEFPINKEIISNLLNNQYKEIIFFKE